MAKQQTAQEIEGSDELAALSFEDILERLSKVVEQLEDGELPLAQALATFERGVALSRAGSTRLDDAERRIEVLLEGDADGVSLRPLQQEQGDE